MQQFRGGRQGNTRISAIHGQFIGFVMLFALVLFPAAAQTPPDPTPAPGGPPNIFYGAVAPGATGGPILVFVPGYNGTAADFWWNQVAQTPNLMYSMAYNAGYRTAFISLSANNSRNTEPWQTKGTTLKGFLEIVSQHFNGAKFYLAGHSEGGLDIEAALLNPEYTAIDPNIASMLKGVFTICTPNQGTPLADWAFGPGQSIAGPLGLLTPGIQALEVAVVGAFRLRADPVFASAGIQFFTYAGNTSKGSLGFNPFLTASGLILDGLVKGVPNDGLVAFTDVQLPYSYAMSLGQNAFNHYNMLEGPSTFPSIDGAVQGLEKEMVGFKKSATGGFGDDNNTFAWSIAWFKGKLYIGTGRQERCVSLEASDVQSGTHYYPPGDSNCPPDPKDLQLQAEIWQYTPETHTWARVYQSPADIPIGKDSSGKQILAAEDIGYRGMIVYTESDGTEALYVGGVTAGEIYGNIPPYTFQTYPGPRILRSTDGVTFTPLPHPAGTYLGDISKNAPTTANVFGFRAFAAYNGMLFATAGNYLGDGYVIASANPSAGGNAWFTAGPPFSQMPVWEMSVFNGQLYVEGGDPVATASYFVAKTSATGTPPFSFTTVVSPGATTPPSTDAALSMTVFNGDLYVGTDGPTELLRIHPDDTWDLIIGDPRMTPEGQKNPLSGISEYFTNKFNRHFWRLGVVPSGAHAGLYLTTYDWSVQLNGVIWEFGNLISGDFGADIYASPDGTTWSMVSTTGFGDGFNYGIRTIAATPFGTFMGTGRHAGGMQVWLDQTVLDYNGDGVIDQRDTNLLLARVGKPANGPYDPMDLDQDGQITLNDAQLLATQCTKAACTIAATSPLLPSPTGLSAANAADTPNVQLTWTAVPGAVQYHVYRQPQTPLLQLFPADGLVVTLGPLTFTVPQDILDGKLNWLCPPQETSTSPVCLAIYVVEDAALPGSTIGFPGPLVEVGIVRSAFYSEPAPTPLQSLYFVRAEDAAGNLSQPSNVVGAPSEAPIGQNPQFRK